MANGETNGETVQGFRGPTVCKTVGITYRQLDYWARTGLVTPSVQDAKGSGSQRLYSFSDVVHLKIIKRLLDAGVSLQQTRKAIDYLTETEQQPLHESTLVSDGTSIYLCKSSDEVIDLLNRGQGVFGIAVGRIYEEVQGSVAELKPDAGAATEQEEAQEGPGRETGHG
ncbi:MAG TPA: MerR family transcriptional regulator [Actinomycetota bacterium]|nr:MerR family transcriptional regulator [Actinomycetota bacterium]